MTAGDKRETQSARENLYQAKTTLAAAVAQCDAARQYYSSLGQHLRELEANGDNLPPDKAAISKYLQELEVCRAEVRIADRVLQQANAAVQAAQAAIEDAEWRCEYDLLERRADTVSEALEKYHHHANAIVEMLAAAQIVGNYPRCSVFARPGAAGPAKLTSAIRVGKPDLSGERFCAT